MSSNLFAIGVSGLKAARTALDITSQNIANANNETYVKRSVALSELAPIGVIGGISEYSPSGVRIEGIVRNADAFRMAEARRTGSDATRASAELAGLEASESALEQAGLFEAMTAFEASLSALAADPVDPSLRAAALESARTLASSFNIAATELEASGEALRFEAADGVAQVNTLAEELGRVNMQIARATPGTSGQAALLDQRDGLLDKISQYAGVSVMIEANQMATVRIGGSAGPQLVSGATASPLAMASAADGTISFTLAGNPVTLDAGELAGKAQALTALKDTLTSLDTIANALISAANTAQGSGVALDGTAGQPLFSGTGAGGIALALTSGSQLATAPSGASANSRDPANLSALRAALTTSDISGRIDGLLFSASSAVSGRKITSEALETIAASAREALESQSGVDLDEEAANLIRYQQAFQASSKAIQAASDIFDTLLGIG